MSKIHISNARNIALAAGLLVLGEMASAQNPKPDMKPAAPKEGLTVQTEIRLRGENRDSFSFDSAISDDPHDQLLRIRPSLTWQQKDGTRLFIQPQFSYGHNFGGMTSTGSYGDLDIHQGYADVKQMGMKWRIGRQELIYGDQRLIGNGNWGNIGRSFDALKATVADKHTKTDLFYGKIGQATARTNDPVIAGIYSTVMPSKKLSYDLYALYKSVDITKTTFQNIYTVGTRPKFAFGKFDGTAEAAYQFGSYASRSVQALAYSANVGYSIPKASGLRLAIEHNYATGGKTTGTGTYRLFDQLYPTNHGLYGIQDFVGWRNMKEWRLIAKAKPAARWNVMADGHVFYLVDGTDSWYGDSGKAVTGKNGAALKDPTGASGRDLGTEMDFVVEYLPLKGLSVQGGYARFNPGDFVKKTNGGKADSSQWFYLQTTYSF